MNEHDGQNTHQFELDDDTDGYKHATTTIVVEHLLTDISRWKNNQAINTDELLLAIIRAGDHAAILIA